MNYMRQSNTLQFEEDPVSKNAQGKGMIMHEALLLMIFLQTQPHNKSNNMNYHDLYDTIIENLSG